MAGLHSQITSAIHRFTPNRRFFRVTLRQENLVERSARALAAGFVELVSQENLLARELRKQLQPANDQSYLTGVEIAFLSVYLARQGSIDVSLWEMYQALGHSGLIGFTFPADTVSDQRRQVVLSTLGWKIHEDDPYMVREYLGQRGSRDVCFAEQLGINNNRRVISFGHGLNIGLEVAAAVNGGKVVGYDIDEVATSSAQHTVSDHPLLHESMAAMGGQVEFVNEPDTLPDYVAPGNLIVFLGVIDESCRYHRHDPQGYYKADRAVGGAMSLVGPGGDFLFGLAAMDVDSLFPRRDPYIDLVRLAGTKREVNFRAERELPPGWRVSVRLFEHRL